MRLLDLELGAVAGKLCLGRLEVVLGNQGIDLGQQVSLLDLITCLDGQLGNLTGDLGPHIHLLHGLQHATGQYGLGDILAGHLSGQHRLGWLTGPEQPAEEHHGDQNCDGQGSLLWGYVHRSPEWKRKRLCAAIILQQSPDK